jgi:hypothetical protein
MPAFDLVVLMLENKSRTRSRTAHTTTGFGRVARSDVQPRLEPEAQRRIVRKD